VVEVMSSLMLAQKYLNFVHGDLHMGNILAWTPPLAKAEWQVNVQGVSNLVQGYSTYNEPEHPLLTRFRIPQSVTNGLRFKIIDFGRSYAKYETMKYYSEAFTTEFQPFKDVGLFAVSLIMFCMTVKDYITTLYREQRMMYADLEEIILTLLGWERGVPLQVVKMFSYHNIALQRVVNGIRLKNYEWITPLGEALYAKREFYSNLGYSLLESFNVAGEVNVGMARIQTLLQSQALEELRIP
jgi:hypothetical protein